MATYHSYCKGLHAQPEGARQLVLDADLPVDLTYEREPTNQFDENAIILRLDDVQIGYVAKEIAAFLAPKMDAGQKFRIEATGLEYTGKRGTTIWIKLLVHTVEEVTEDTNDDD